MHSILYPDRFLHRENATAHGENRFFTRFKWADFIETLTMRLIDCHRECETRKELYYFQRNIYIFICVKCNAWNMSEIALSPVEISQCNIVVSNLIMITRFQLQNPFEVHKLLNNLINQLGSKFNEVGSNLEDAKDIYVKIYVFVIS